jgi:YbbR domain-containing protein
MKQTSTFGISENTSYKIVALLITLILWVIILGNRESSMLKMIPTEYLLPRDAMIVNNVPHEVAFKVIGPRLVLRKFADSSEPLTIDLSSALEGLTTVRIHPDSINVPSGLRVVSVMPATITPSLEKIISRKAAIHLVTSGTLPQGLMLKSIEIIPNEWTVSGARSVIEKLSVVQTAPIDLSKIKDSLSEDVPLIIDEQGVIKQKDPRVRINLVVK